MDNGQQAARAQALELLEQRNYRDALNLLTQNLPPETDGEGRALLALTHYHLEEYVSAASPLAVIVAAEEVPPHPTVRPPSPGLSSTW